jgi:hypothetical protein
MPLKKWPHVLYSATPNAASRKKAVLAVARQFAVDLWRIFIWAKAEAFGLKWQEIAFRFVSSTRARGIVAERAKGGVAFEGSERCKVPEGCKVPVP